MLSVIPPLCLRFLLVGISCIAATVAAVDGGVVLGSVEAAATGSGTGTPTAPVIPAVFTSASIAAADVAVLDSLGIVVLMTAVSATNANCELTAIAAATGSVLWQRRLNTSSDGLSCMDPSTEVLGTEWTVPSPQEEVAAVVMVVNSHASLVVVLDGLTGAVRAEAALPPSIVIYKLPTSSFAESAVVMKNSELVVFCVMNTSTDSYGTVVLNLVTGQFAGNAADPVVMATCPGGLSMFSVVDFGPMYVQICYGQLFPIFVSQSNPVPVIHDSVNYTNHHHMAYPSFATRVLQSSLLIAAAHQFEYAMSMFLFDVDTTSGELNVAWDVEVSDDYQSTTPIITLFPPPAEVVVIQCYGYTSTAVALDVPTGYMFWATVLPSSIPSTSIYIPHPVNASLAFCTTCPTTTVSDSTSVPIVAIRSLEQVGLVTNLPQLPTAAVMATILVHHVPAVMQPADFPTTPVTYLIMPCGTSLAFVDPLTNDVIGVQDTGNVIGTFGVFPTTQQVYAITGAFTIYSNTSNGWNCRASTFVSQGRVAYIVNRQDVSHVMAVDPSGTVLWTGSSGLRAASDQPEYLGSLQAWGPARLLLVEGAAMISVLDSFRGTVLATVLIPSDCGVDAIAATPSILFTVEEGRLEGSVYFTAGLRCLFWIDSDLTLHSVRTSIVLTGAPVIDADNHAVYASDASTNNIVAIPLNSDTVVKTALLGPYSRCVLVPSSTLADPATLGRGLNTIVYTICQSALNAVVISTDAGGGLSGQPSMLLWSWTAEGFIAAYAAGSNVYTMSNAGVCRMNLNASITTNQQRTIWCLGNLYTTTGTAFSDEMIVTPDGVLLFTINEKLFAIDAVTGAARWTSEGFVSLPSPGCESLEFHADIVAVQVVCQYVTVYLIDALPNSQHQILATVTSNSELIAASASGPVLYTFEGVSVTATLLPAVVMNRLMKNHSSITPATPQYPPPQTAAPGATAAPAASGSGSSGSQPTTDSSYTPLTTSMETPKPIYFATPTFSTNGYFASYAITSPVPSLFPHVVFSYGTPADSYPLLAAVNMSGGVAVTLWELEVPTADQPLMVFHDVDGDESSAVLVISAWYHVRCVNASSGEILWFTASLSCIVLVALEGTPMVMCVANEMIRFFNVTDGTLVYEYIPTSPFTSTSVMQGMVHRISGNSDVAGVTLASKDFLHVLRVPLKNVSGTTTVWTQSLNDSPVFDAFYGMFASIPKFGRHSNHITSRDDAAGGGAVFATFVNMTQQQQQQQQQLVTVRVSWLESNITNPNHRVTVIDAMNNFTCGRSWWLMFDPAGTPSSGLLYLGACTTVYRLLQPFGPPSLVSKTAFFSGFPSNSGGNPLNTATPLPSFGNGSSSSSTTTSLLFSIGGTMMVVDAATGAVQWNVTLPGDVFTTGYYGDVSPVVQVAPDGSILTQTMQNPLIAIQQSGFVAWRVGRTEYQTLGTLTSVLIESGSRVDGYYDVVITGGGGSAVMGSYLGLRGPFTHAGPQQPAATTFCVTGQAILAADDVGHLTALVGGYDTFEITDVNATWSTTYKKASSGGGGGLPNYLQRIGDATVVLETHAISVLEPVDGNQTAYVALSSALCPVAAGGGPLFWIGHTNPSSSSSSRVTVVVTDGACVYSMILDTREQTINASSVSVVVVSIGALDTAATTLIESASSAAPLVAVVVVASQPGIVQALQLSHDGQLSALWSSSALGDLSLCANGATPNLLPLSFPAGTPLNQQQLVLWTTLGAVGVSLGSGATVWLQKLQVAPLSGVSLVAAADGSLFAVGSTSCGKISMDLTSSSSSGGLLQWTAPFPAGLVNFVGDAVLSWQRIAAVPASDVVVAVAAPVANLGPIVAAFNTTSGSTMWFEQVQPWQMKLDAPIDVSFVLSSSESSSPPREVIVFCGATVVLEIATGYVVGVFPSAQPVLPPLSTLTTSASRAISAPNMWSTTRSVMLVLSYDLSGIVCVIPVPNVSLTSTTANTVLPVVIAQPSPPIPVGYAFHVPPPTSNVAPPLSFGAAVPLKRWTYRPSLIGNNAIDTASVSYTNISGGRNIVVLLTPTNAFGSPQGSSVVAAVDQYSGEALPQLVPASWSSPSNCNATLIFAIAPIYLGFVCFPTLTQSFKVVTVLVFDLSRTELVAETSVSLPYRYYPTDIDLAPFPTPRLPAGGCFEMDEAIICAVPEQPSTALPPSSPQSFTFFNVSIVDASQSVFFDDAEQQLIQALFYDSQGLINISAISAATGVSSVVGERLWTRSIEHLSGAVVFATTTTVGGVGAPYFGVFYVAPFLPPAPASSSDSDSSSASAVGPNGVHNFTVTILDTVSGEEVLVCDLGVESAYSMPWNLWFEPSGSASKKGDFFAAAVADGSLQVFHLEVNGRSVEPMWSLPVEYNDESAVYVGRDPVTGNTTVYIGSITNNYGGFVSISGMDLVTGSTIFTLGMELSSQLGYPNDISLGRITDDVMVFSSTTFDVVMNLKDRLPLTAAHLPNDAILAVVPVAGLPESHSSLSASSSNSSSAPFAVDVVTSNSGIKQFLFDTVQASTVGLPVAVDHFEYVTQNGGNGNRNGGPIGAIVASFGTAVYLFNTSGELVWGTVVDDGTVGSAHVFDPIVVRVTDGAAGATRDVVIKSGEAQTVYGFDAQNGALLFVGMLPACDGVAVSDGSSSTQEQPQAATVAFDDASSTLFVSAGSLCVYALNISSAATNHKDHTGQHAANHSESPTVLIASTLVVSHLPQLPSTLLVTPSCVISADTFGKVTCLSRLAAGADVLWTFNSGYTGTPVGVSMHDSMLVIHFADKIAVLNEASGTVWYELTVAPTVTSSSLASFNNTLFVVSTKTIAAYRLDPNILMVDRLVWAFDALPLLSSTTDALSSWSTSPPVIAAVSGTLLTSFGSLLVGVDTATGRVVFSQQQSAPCTSVSVGSNTANSASIVNAVFIAVCGAERLHSVVSGAALLELQSAKDLEGRGGNYLGGCSKIPSVILPTSGLLVSCSYDTTASMLIQPVPQVVVNAVPPITSTAKTSPPAAYTVAPGYAPEGVPTPAPTLPPGADSVEPLPDLSCALNINAMYGSLASCLTAAGGEYFPNHSVPLSGVACIPAAAALTRCFEAWLTGSYCAASLRYAASVITLLNGTDGGFGGLCSGWSQLCTDQDQDKGSAAICGALGLITSTPLPLAVVEGLPQPANVLPMYRVTMPPPPPPSAAASGSRHLSSSEVAGIACGGMLLCLSAIGAAWLIVKGRKSAASSSSAAYHAAERASLLHHQPGGTHSTSIQEASAEPPSTPSSRELRSMSGSDPAMKYESV